MVLPDGVRPASLFIDAGTIVDVGGYGAAAGDAVVTDVGDLTISPGVIDPHVHINEPGRTEWEGFDTATRAAAAGGITTLIDMPLNSTPATTSVEALYAKRTAAAGRVHVDVGFWGGLVPGNSDELGPLAQAGVPGYKCFLAPSGVDDFEAVDESSLRAGFERVRAPRRVLVHAEDPALLRAPHGNRRVYASYLATRPPEAEASAIRLVGRLIREHGLGAHIVHVSSEEGVAAIAALQHAGANLTAETCPHYLTFSADAIPDGATQFKCAPPIREARHREALWQGLRDGVLMMVATDHSPSPPAMKQIDTGDFDAAWGGIASLQLSLPAVWTEARRRGFDEADLARWMSAGPAALLTSSSIRKGSLSPRLDADFVVWDPEAAFVARGSALEHRHPLTPYEGRTLSGLVHATYLRGTCVWKDGSLQRVGSGQLL